MRTVVPAHTDPKASFPALSGDLADRARRWIDGDPDPVTAASLTTLLAAAEAGDPAALHELSDAAGTDLAFGTAGLRGTLGAGPNRMNSAVVIRAAAAIAGFLVDRLAGPAGPADPSPQVIVGYDARHGSARFATDTAEAMTAAGCRVAVLPAPLPTPVLAGSVRRYGADAGIMVTASHNPATDNGYKVYLGGRAAPDPGAGVQIVPPVDAEIAARISAGPRARDVPRAQDGWQVLGDDVLDAYVAGAAATAHAPDQASRPPHRRLKVVVTALHGVGADTLRRVLVAAGFEPPHFVASQREPDPDFPTVAFPNPEEPGALDEAFALARAVDADLVIAVDPDADRCALGVPDLGALGGWRRLSGDETGVLLGDHVLTRRDVADPAVDRGSVPTVAASIVSSSMLERVAEAHGVSFAATLTGFKWIARVPGLVYGYEEAIGYCVDPASVRDKDGISTAALACELAAGLKQSGHTLQQRLDELDIRYGIHATAPVTVRLSDTGVIPALLAGLLADPPATLDGLPVTSITDLSVGGERLPGTPGVRLTCDGVRVVVRPSGTEPKIKAYVQVVRDVAAPQDLRRERGLAAERLAGIVRNVGYLLAMPA